MLHINILFDFRKPGVTRTIYPADVILFEGILVFYWKEVRDMFNMKLFVDTDADTRLSRRGLYLFCQCFLLHFTKSILFQASFVYINFLSIEAVNCVCNSSFNCIEKNSAGQGLTS